MTSRKIPAPLYRRVGDEIYLSGHVGFDAAGVPVADFGGHAQQVFDNLQETLQREGASLSDLVTATCYLSDFKNFDTFNGVWAANFESTSPARTTVEVRFRHPGVLLEISAVARLDQ